MPGEDAEKGIRRKRHRKYAEMKMVPSFIFEVFFSNDELADKIKGEGKIIELPTFLSGVIPPKKLGYNNSLLTTQWIVKD